MGKLDLTIEGEPFKVVKSNVLC